jgi:hypothetical protein
METSDNAPSSNATFEALGGASDSPPNQISQTSGTPLKVTPYHGAGNYLEDNYLAIPKGSEPRTIEVGFKINLANIGGSLVSFGSVSNSGSMFEIYILPD